MKRLASFLLRCFFESIFSAREGGTPSHGAMGYPVLAFILGGFGVCVGVFWPHLGSSLEVVCLHVGTTPSLMGNQILNRFFSNFWPQGPMGYLIFGSRVRWGTPFLVDFCNQFGANLAPSWVTLVNAFKLELGPSLGLITAEL